MLSETKDIHVIFLSQDLGFADPLARALGAGFDTRSSNEIEFNRSAIFQEWCDVVLLDMRSASAQGDYEPGLRLLDEICKLPSYPPIVALCDEGDRQVILTVIERGAYDTVTNPPNMMELRLV